LPNKPSEISPPGRILIHGIATVFNRDAMLQYRRKVPSLDLEPRSNAAREAELIWLIDVIVMNSNTGQSKRRPCRDFTPSRE
jgi:hypothetical protein